MFDLLLHIISICPRCAVEPLIVTSDPLLRHELRCLAAAILARDHAEVQVHLQPDPSQQVSRRHLTSRAV
jgi:hypothetical protein